MRRTAVHPPSLIEICPIRPGLARFCFSADHLLRPRTRLTGGEVQAAADEAKGHYDSSDAASQRERRRGEREAEESSGGYCPFAAHLRSSQQLLHSRIVYFPET